jgi:hypothetical protein
MIGENEMVWTAICERDGQAAAVCFNSENDAKVAFKNIIAIIQCDGYKVLCLLKGDQTKSFYSINSTTGIISTENTLDEETLA